MNLPRPEQFVDFYRAVYSYDPFPWQRRLAERLCNDDWPESINLPTASGKTTCIDIALFALACRPGSLPRRIFVVVDRRIVVDQAYLHARHLAKTLHRAESGIMRETADALRCIADPERSDPTDEVRPVDVYSLRGGMYRETAWTRSPLQPTVIASTVDQVGSRLLFRGYGVTPSMMPVHAALTGNDSVIFLDEAHCSRPFEQTMQAIENYRSWNRPAPPFRFVSITATPAGSRSTLSADQDDFHHPVLGRRFAAAKPAELVLADKARGKQALARLADAIEKKARQLAEKCASVGIIVNRVRTARELWRRLAGDDAVLLTGRMRPLDRDRLLATRLAALLSNSAQTPPRFVIGTQCLECGADFDFHGLVTECASLDALRQRFGRLNRVARPDRPPAQAAIVMRGDQVQEKDDPIYGQSLSDTWTWLTNRAPDGVFDFGVNALGTILESLNPAERAALNAPAENAPVLFPAHLDAWVQTSPIPAFDPDPAPFLHGPTRPGQPDVQVVFRADLGADVENWADVVALCPPSSAEAVAVPIGVFKSWLAGEVFEDDTGDVEGEGRDDSEADALQRPALRWCGPEASAPVQDLRDIRPDNVFVVPCSADGPSVLGDFPYGLTDVADEAYQQSRDRALLRMLHCRLNDEDEDFDDLLSAEIQALQTDDAAEWLKLAVEKLSDPHAREVERHPLGGFVVTGKYRLKRHDPTHLDDSEPAESFRGREVKLDEHLRDVAGYAARFAAGCGLDAERYRSAGLWHDLGKLDPRFQALLRQSSPRTAVGEPLAKSARAGRTRAERDEARKVHCYPDGARHELLSAALLATRTNDDLLLHLVATHHGFGRPFALGVEENAAVRAPFRTPELFGVSFELSTSAQQIALWNADLPERFWRMVRTFGWWGSAYREAILRLADHAASRAEQEKKPAKARPDTERSAIDAVVRALRPAAVVAEPVPRSPACSLPLVGLDGANPLAFLAALGTLVVGSNQSGSDDPPPWLAGPVALSWGTPAGAYTPVLHLPAAPPPPSAFAEYLAEHLARRPEEHDSARVVNLLERLAQDKTLDLAREVQKERVHCTPNDRRRLDWLTALVCDSVPDGASQLQTVRRDYLLGNIRSILARTTADHLRRTLFEPWDYADALDNQSLHWEPSEDRRHAYQWHMPSGDPTRKRRGGMLGANRLAFEAWPLLPSFAAGNNRLATRGFTGNRANNTYWTWPLWRQPLTRAAIGSMLDLKLHGKGAGEPPDSFAFGVYATFRLQRILVGKTPNFTTALALV